MGDEEPRRILLTGLAGELAGRLAARLEADDRVDYIAGVDLVEPAHDLRRTEFIRADLRSSAAAKVVESTRVDTIVHLAIVAAPEASGGRRRMMEMNVIGSMQLLAAAQKASRVRKLVVRSSTAVYGSSHRQPSLIGEDAEVEAHAAAGYTKDAIEVEGYVRAFGRRRPDVTITVLRLANLVGPTAVSPLTRYFELPVVPTVLGSDPRIQFCHEADGLAVLEQVVRDAHPGVFNVAGEGVLYLSQAIRIAGKPMVPVLPPLAGAVAGLLRRAGNVDFSPEQLQFLRNGRVADVTRMREILRFTPTYTTRSAFEDYALHRLAGPITPERVARAEQRVLELLGRGPAPTVDGRPTQAGGA